MMFIQHLYRTRCWLRGYHVYGAAGINMFKYHIAGSCYDCCGPVAAKQKMTALRKM